MLLLLLLSSFGRRLKNIYGIYGGVVKLSKSIMLIMLNFNRRFVVLSSSKSNEINLTLLSNILVYVCVCACLG